MKIIFTFGTVLYINIHVPEYHIQYYTIYLVYTKKPWFNLINLKYKIITWLCKYKGTNFCTWVNYVLFTVSEQNVVVSMWSECLQNIQLINSAHCLTGMGCFWGAERKFWKTDGVYSTQVDFKFHMFSPIDMMMWLLALFDVAVSPFG